MREIKFRAWDTEVQQYAPVTKLVMSPRTGDAAEMLGIYSIDDWSSIYSLEQFTGLHDKNGKEIYEGDIVKLHVVILSPDDSIGVIKYSPEFGYCINFGERVARQEYWAANDNHTIEVIGNIHENPELLEKTGAE